jgi:mycofactocin glycosyltransferase
VAARSLWSAALQLASAICRHYWPVALLAAIAFRPCRRVVLVAAIFDGVVDWASRRQSADDDAQPIGLLTYLLLKRVDDLAYGLGLWYGVVRERNIGPLKPQIRV